MNNLLNGLSKTLKLAGDIIPIYKDTKPVINKVKKFVLNDKLTKNNTVKNNISKNKNQNLNVQNNNVLNKKITSNQSNPQFFI